MGNLAAALFERKIRNMNLTTLLHVAIFVKVFDNGEKRFD
jgi:hypothetical protein